MDHELGNQYSINSQATQNELTVIIKGDRKCYSHVKTVLRSSPVSQLVTYTS
ncbi:hypothetical protein [Anabaena sp. UHCC 0399]|uniref:hypothetical protein n=1 Tax=Anabaena sp. UHCC 0399 TaxID=3110238 RepID=UPI002B2015C8|nr:hypothetical protein [Anabaena sp. UHCC 0399]MEA5566479.1 hypothetical protein [Anabaena sp. UHCC 0399]